MKRARRKEQADALMPMCGFVFSTTLACLFFPFFFLGWVAELFLHHGGDVLEFFVDGFLGIGEFLFFNFHFPRVCCAVTCGEY